MSPQEKRASLALAGIFSFRMMGLFMVLPIFTLYAQHLTHATPFLIGMALGVYGLTQGCLQIPFGMASDKIGRKPVIATGLILFALGSVIAALSGSIYGVMIGRALQGAGAIGSATIALLADLTRDEHRTKAMATIGMCIGFSFSVAIVLGPILNTLIHVSGIFWLTAVLACIGLYLLFKVTPTPEKETFHQENEPVLSQFPKILKDRNLLRLNASIFAQHMLLTANFIVLPMILLHTTGLTIDHQAILYLPVMIIAFAFAIPCIIVAEKKKRLKQMLITCVLLLGFSEFCLWFLQHHALGIGFALSVFFCAFTILEAILPSLVSRLAPKTHKGTAMGVYSTAQFLGIFVGGLLAGFIYQHYHITDVFLFCLILVMLWLLTIIGLTPPQLNTEQTKNPVGEVKHG